MIIYSTDLKSSDFKEFEYWGDEYFEKPDSLKNNIKKDSLKISYGFLPKTYLNWGINLISKTKGWNYNSGYVDIQDQFTDFDFNYVFTAQPPIDNSDLEDKIIEKKYFSDDNKYNIFNPYENAKVFVLGASIDYTFPELHTTTVMSAGYSYRNISLYSPIFISYYLDNSSNKKQFEEIIILDINDKSFFSSINLRHPIYGASIRSSDYAYSSFYYLTYGVGCDYVISNKADVSRYILSESNNIRFTNGETKELFFSNRNISGVSEIRYNFNIGIGWTLDFLINSTNHPINICFELNYCSYINPHLKNTNFRQNILNFHICLRR